VPNATIFCRARADGSGAGSIVAYSLRITDIDPLKYDLLFERFLNPERISMPDFDVDFCFERRGEVIDYVTRKYGDDRVGQIITFGTLKAKAVVKDVARSLDIPFEEANNIAKLIPEDPKMTLETAFEMEPRLRGLRKTKNTRTCSKSRSGSKTCTATALCTPRASLSAKPSSWISFPCTRIQKPAASPPSTPWTTWRTAAWLKWIFWA
jgi:hypothetical protein